MRSKVVEDTGCFFFFDDDDDDDKKGVVVFIVVVVVFIVVFTIHNALHDHAVVLLYNGAVSNNTSSRSVTNTTKKVNPKPTVSLLKP